MLSMLISYLHMFYFCDSILTMKINLIDEYEKYKAIYNIEAKTSHLTLVINSGITYIKVLPAEKISEYLHAEYRTRYTKRD